MSIQGPPAPQQKKSGLGCCGCGCIVLGVILLLVLAFVGLVIYACYEGALAFTTTTPASFTMTTESDDVYQGAEKKIAAFNQSVNSHQPTSLTLNSDEVSAIIQHNPALAKLQAKANVTMTDDQAHVQFSMPTGSGVMGLLKDRYVNLDTSFSVSFDPDQHNIIFSPKTLQIGDMILLGPGADPATSANLSHSFTDQGPGSFNYGFNQQMHKDPASENLLEQIKTITIQNGQLVIETQ